MLGDQLARIRALRLSRYYLGFLQAALIAHPAPAYTDLLFELWEQDGYVTHPVFDLLSRRDPARTTKLARRALGQIGQLSQENRHLAFGGDEDAGALAVKMLDLIVSQDREGGIHLLSQALSDSDVLIFQKLVKRVPSLKSSVLNQSIAKRLAVEWNGYVVWAAIKELRATGDVEALELAKRSVGQNPELIKRNEVAQATEELAKPREGAGR